MLIDLTGQRFGKLLVTQRAGSDWQKGATWYCDCDCGKLGVVIRGSNLRDGVSSSCGCTVAPSIVGKKFNRLLVISEYKNEKDDKYCSCLCDCGNQKEVARGHLLDGSVKSCGCLKHEKEDLIGQRFGRLVVIERARISDNRNVYWLCQCDCGNTKEIMGRGLKQGQTQSCGCLRKELSEEQAEDLSGQRFGKLVAIEIVRKIMSTGLQKIYWKCLCDCGNYKVSAARTLKSGQSISCGCFRKIKAKNNFIINCFKRIYKTYKTSAKKRKLDFEITQELVEYLIQQNCTYCGRKPFNFYRNPQKEENFFYNGIDRVNNNLGYTIDNVVTCCCFCNWGKRNKTKEEFFKWIRDVFNYSVKDLEVAN